jgi:hypothetical protein
MGLKEDGAQSAPSSFFNAEKFLKSLLNKLFKNFSAFV